MISLRTEVEKILPEWERWYGNLFDAAIMKLSVISDDFRARYLSNPADPLAFEEVRTSGIVAQRLLRRLCPACRSSYRPSQEQRLLIEAMGTRVEKNETLYSPVGCAECDHDNG